MFWLLLPPDANAGRHLDDETRRSVGFWSHLVHAVWERIFPPAPLGPR